MASAASSSRQLLLFFLLISTCFLPPPCLSLDANKEADNNTVEKVDSPELELSFSFDFSNASSYDAGDLRFEGNASVHGSLINLACDSFGQSVDGCTGRISYNHSVPFHDDDDDDTAPLASFSTSFTFVIKPDGEAAPGDGIAFFLSGYPSSMPPNTDGGSLGLMDDDAAAYGLRVRPVRRRRVRHVPKRRLGGSQRQPHRCRHQHCPLVQHNRFERIANKP
jgi:hypothetical protein